MNGPTSARTAWRLNTPGAGLPRNTAFNNEFVFQLDIPATVDSLRVIITGVNNSPQERYIVRDVSITGSAPTGDSDGDGVNDAAEAIAGTDPHDPASYLRITSFTPAPGAANSMRITFPSVTGRDYRLYSSTDLQNWTAIGPVQNGTNADLFSDITPAPAPGQDKIFYRIMVGPDGFAFP